MKEFSYIKDKNGNLLRVAPMPVVFGRAIPAHNARAGMRYMVRGGRFCIKNLTEQEVDTYISENLVNYHFYPAYENLVTVGGVDSNGIPLNPEGIRNCHYIVTIPENFDIDKFIRNTDGYRNKCMKSANNYTGETMSPNFVYRNGRLVCTKELLVHFNRTLGADISGRSITLSMKKFKKGDAKYWKRVFSPKPHGTHITYFPMCVRGYKKYIGQNSVKLSWVYNGLGSCYKLE